MAAPKRNQLFNVLVPMVDKTDFASIESGVTQSALLAAGTKKLWQWNDGASVAAASVTISKTVRLVRSGVFQVTLNPAETNFDKVLIWLEHPSCAPQLILQEFADFDDSDLMSRVSDMFSVMVGTGVQLNNSSLSDLRSAIAAGPAATVTASDISDIASAVGILLASRLSDILSGVNAIQSNVSDIESAVDSQWAASPDASDVASAVAVEVASRLSDILSAAVQINSRALVLQSLVSDVDSALTSRFSDLLSLLATTGVQINASALSDIRSAITLGPTGALTVSDISDIASRVTQALASDLSDILSAARLNSSRALVNQSMISDVQSAVALVKAKTDNLPSAIKKNTALANFEFVMVLASNGNPAPGLTVTAERSIDGAALTTMVNAPVGVSNGLYKINLDAADTNGDVITYRFSSATARDRWVTIVTKP